jgi:hypothetical protein
MINCASLSTTVYQVDSIFTKDYVKAAITGNATKAYEITEYYTFNKKRFF